MAALTPSDLDAESIRQVTARVLEGPAYEPARFDTLQAGVERVVDAIAVIAAALPSPAVSGIGVVVLAVAVALVVVIAWRLLHRVRHDRARPPQPGAVGGRSPQAWEREAARRAEVADWVGALRCHYRALLAELVGRGVIDEVAGRTARAYQREIATACPAAADAMTTVTAAFEAAWYGDRHVSSADVTALRDAAATVRRHVPVAA